MQGEAISKLLEQCDKLRKEDIRHPELGEIHGFQELQSAKDSALDYVTDVLGRALVAAPHMSEAVLESYVGVAQGFIGDLRGGLKLADAALREGVNQPNYPTKRVKAIDQVKGSAKKVQVGLAPLDTHLGFLEMRRVLVDEKSLASARDLAIKAEKDYESVAEILASLRSASLEKSLQSGEATFSRLRDAHRWYELRWFGAFCISLVAVLVAVSWAIFSDLGVSSADAIVGAVKRLLAISVAGVLAKAALSKYNLERNLRILYDHRISVFDQFRAFDDAIGDEDREAKTRLRLEIAKYLFEDPQTGYTAEGASELNISPVINLADGMATRLKASG